MATEQLPLIDTATDMRILTPAAWRYLCRDLPHNCFVCDAPIDNEAWGLGNDGQILCPAHIGTVA